MTAFALTLHSFGVDGTWTNNASGNWSATGNWAGGNVADGAGSLADFSTVDLTASRTNTLDSSRTIGRLIFGDLLWTSSGYDWALSSSGGSVLTLDNTGGTGGPSITISNRTTTISALLAGSNGLSLVLPFSNYDTTRGTAVPSSGMLPISTIGALAMPGSNALSGAANVSGGTVTVGGTAGKFGAATSLAVTGNGVFVNGDATATNNNGKVNRIGDGTATLTLGGAAGAGTYTSAFAGSGNTVSQAFGGLTVNAGQNVLNTANIVAGNNNLIFTGAGGGGYVRSTNGILNVVPATGFNPQFANAPVATGGSSVSGTAGSGDEILVGAVLNGSDFAKAASGNLAAATYVTTLTAGKNVNVTGVLATSGSISINSLRMGDTTRRTVTVGASDTLTITSGGIILPYSTGATATQANFNHTINGGSLTSGGGDLWIYAATGAYNYGFTRGNGDPRGANYAATIASKITGNISVTVGGGAVYNGVQNGYGAAQVLLSGVNDYTGGTYMVGGELRINADSGLGHTNGTITVVSGVNSIQPTAAITFNASRNFVINSGALLQVSASSTIPGRVSGGGVLEIGVVGGYALTLTATNSGFTGQYFVSGQLRADEGVGLSTNANILLGGRGGNANSGILETSGTFTRSLGSGAGQVQWTSSGYIDGGFSAVGGPLTVNLGGNATPATLTWGSNGFVASGAWFWFGDTSATDDVTFQNPIALNGAQRTIAVTANGSTKAMISGALSGDASSGISKQGTGTLVLSGNNTYAGPTLVSAGTLALGYTNALQNSTLDMGLAGSQQVTLTVSGTNTYNLGGLRGTNNLALSANTLVVGSNNSTNTYWGALSGLGGGLVKTGAGMLTLAGTNTYTGATIAQTGVLELTRTNALSVATALDIRSGAEVRLSFTGTNVVYSLTVNGSTKSRGVYAVGSVPGLTGTASAYLQTLQPPPRGTMIRFL